MQKLMTAPQYRRYMLLNIFAEFQSFWISYDQLLKKTGFSKRILLNTIQELEDYGAVWDRRGDFIRMDLVESSSLETIYRKFFCEIPSLLIIEDIFFNPDTTTAELADKNNVSRATIYRYINKLNEDLLYRFKISIDSKTQQFTGDESDIRYFLAEYFAEKYPVFSWPFGDSDHEKLIDDSIEILGSFVLDENKNSYDLSFAYKHYMKITLAVNLLRTLQGFRVPDFQSPLDVIYNNRIDEPHFRKYIKRFEEYFNHEVKFDMDLIKQTYTMFARSTFFFSSDDLYEASINDLYVRKSITLLNRYLEEIKEKFNTQPSDNDLFLMMIHNTHHMEEGKLYVQPILFNRKSLSLHEYRYVSPDFYDLVKSQMKSYRKELNLEENTYLESHILYVFFSHWGIFSDLIEDRDILKIGVVNIFDIDSAKNTVNIINRLFKNQYEAEIACWDPLLNWEKLAESDYDIIVTNFDIEPIPGKYILNFTSPSDVHSLQEIVNLTAQKEYLDNVFYEN